MNKNKNSKIWKKSEFYFILIYLLLMIALAVQLMITQIVPNKYSILIIAVLIIILILLSWLEFNKRINKFNKILGKVLIIIVCIALCVGNFFIFRGYQTLNDISDVSKKTDTLSVIVLKTNDVQENEIEKLKDSNFAVLKNQDRDNTDKAIEEISDIVNNNIQTTDYNSTFEMAAALYDKETDVIIMNEAYRGFFQDNEENTRYKDFDTETKIIYQVQIDSAIEDISKTTDVTKNPFNVFISGIDTYGSVNTTSRSDVNMLASVNPVTHQILLTSIPRDYYVVQSCQGGQLDKLTHAGIFGVECSVSSVENLFGTDINYYVRVNFSSLIDIVDALGGITVESASSFTAQGYSFVEGTNEMNGLEALAFSRDRYHQDGGDRGRGKNQMRVITGIVNKAISPSIIMNYSGVMSAIGGSFQTNMESSDITKFIQKQLDSMSGWDIIQNSVDGEGGTDWTPANGFNAYVMYPDQTSVDHAKLLIDQIMSGQTLTE